MGSPFAERRAVNNTLASWGIIQVPDFGLLYGNTTLDSLEARDNTVGSFRAFFGNNCNDGTGGATITFTAVDVKCIGTTNNHSFRVVGGPLYVSADPNQSCPSKDTGSAPGGKAYAGCYNVNTGLDWRSSYVYYSPS